MSWGCFIEKGGPTKRVVLWAPPIRVQTVKEQTEVLAGPKLEVFGIPIAWYKARIAGFPPKSIREGETLVFKV